MEIQNKPIQNYFSNKELFNFFVKNRHKMGEVEVKQSLCKEYIKLNDGIIKDCYTSLLTTLELTKYFHNFIKRGKYNFKAINYQFNENSQTKHKVFLFTEKETNKSKLELFAYLSFSEIN